VNALPEPRPLLQVDGLSVEFGGKGTRLRVVDEVSFDIKAGETVGLVGESGSGKSVTALSILRLVPEPPGHLAGGRVLLDGVDLTTLPADRLPEIRGRDIAMIFQEPMSSLNPVMRIGDQIGEAILLHQRLDAGSRRARVLELLGLVGMPDPERRINAYPHQFSGGMRQRVMIAMALACNPRLLIADEPTTALDVTIQAQVLALLRELKAEFGTAILLITHDLGVVAESCQRVVVMYAGRVVESGPVRAIFREPSHPYTRALLHSIPRLDEERRRLHQIPGNVPPPGPLRAGCAFHTRCVDRLPRCATERPPSVRIGPGHHAACWLARETAEAPTVGALHR
jgi:oligopeptide/dipeptide ABC transporter ATP-binding protein